MRPILLNTAVKEPTRVATRRAGKERGSALILAIAMLAILSILGSIALMTSDTEMKVTGNYQAAKQTFWSADRAVEYATSRNILMTMGNSVNLVSGTIVVGGVTKTHKELIDAAGGGFLRGGVVTDLGSGPLPTKLAGTYGTDFGANYYQVSVEARQRDDDTSAAVRVDTTIVRIYKNDTDTILRTTGY